MDTITMPLARLRQMALDNCLSFLIREALHGLRLPESIADTLRYLQVLST